ncbi:MAG: hypothetical protein VX460_11125 [Planctomycetota bacterium]|nr:hypothetical protein [Planctomycetota bacterium]
MAPSRDEVQRALDQLTDIHAQVARASIYRGYRAAPVAGMGFIAFAVAAYEALRADDLGPWAHAMVWLVVALVCATIGAADLWRRRRAVSGRDTWTAVGQLVPALLVGLAMTWLLSDRPELLPGVWTSLFGLGVLASRPYLPAPILGVALFYVAAGLAMAAAARAGVSPSPWAMGITFLVGQLCAATVLRRSSEEVTE